MGHYDPRRDPSVIVIDNDKAVAWLKKGAQPTERVAKLLKVSGAYDVLEGKVPVAAAAPAGGESAGESDS